MDFLIRKWTNKPTGGDGWYLFRFNNTPPDEISRIVKLTFFTDGMVEIHHEAIGCIRFRSSDGYHAGEFIKLHITDETTE